MLLRLHHYYCYSCSLNILHSLLSQIDSTAPVLERKKCGASNSVTRGITDWRDDKNGTSYPPKGSVYMTVSRTANSNKELTLVYLKNIMFPAFGVTDKEAFNFHSMRRLQGPQRRTGQGIYVGPKSQGELKVSYYEGWTYPCWPASRQGCK